MGDPAKLAGGKLGEYAYSSPAEGSPGLPRDRSLADVVRDIIGDIQNIVRSEVRLAKAEMQEEAGKTIRAAGMLAGGALVALFAVGCLVLCLIYALSNVVAPWLAALLVGVGLLVLAGVLVSIGRNRLKDVTPTPEKTVHSVKENVEWMKNQTKS